MVVRKVEKSHLHCNKSSGLLSRKSHVMNLWIKMMMIDSCSLRNPISVKQTNVDPVNQLLDSH